MHQLRGQRRHPRGHERREIESRLTVEQQFVGDQFVGDLLAQPVLRELVVRDIRSEARFGWRTVVGTLSLLGGKRHVCSLAS
jgi:hypothetical protein